jgi:predicted small integral membrane protein
VGVTAFILAPILLKESRDATVKSFDALGAVLVTGGLSSLVYAITQAGQDGWLAGRTVSFFAASLAMLVGFLVWEQRHPEPLMRLGILRIKTVSGANVAGFIMGTATFSLFLMFRLFALFPKEPPRPRERFSRKMAVLTSLYPPRLRAAPEPVHAGWS